ncbi:hypothetical protein E8E11_000733 [Didymella keratinophila]|nr:hypothetical protein E8E11_000733 [Didymella keratinophila]
MDDAFVINVGGRPFTTLKSTLEQSPYFANMLSPRWAESTTYHVNGAPFVDRSPLLFEHILDFLRSAAPPIFWTRTNGFDLPLYASLLREAEYLQVEALATWIRNEQIYSDSKDAQKPPRSKDEYHAFGEHSTNDTMKDSVT